MKKFEFTNEEVEVLKTHAGYIELLTDADIEKLKDGTADEKQVYWVEKKLSKWRQEKHAQEKQQQKQMQQPVSRGELVNFVSQHFVSKQSYEQLLLRQEAVIRLLGEKFGPKGLVAGEWIRDEDINRASQEIIVERLQDFCGLCSLNATCTKECAVMAKSRFPLVGELYANKVIECSDFVRAKAELVA